MSPIHYVTIFFSTWELNDQNCLASEVLLYQYQYCYVRYQEAKLKEEVAGIPYSKLTIGVPKETFLNEKRVAVTPASVQV